MALFDRQREAAARHKTRSQQRVCFEKKIGCFEQVWKFIAPRQVNLLLNLKYVVPTLCKRVVVWIYETDGRDTALLAGNNDRAPVQMGMATRSIQQLFTKFPVGTFFRWRPSPARSAESPLMATLAAAF